MNSRFRFFSVAASAAAAACSALADPYVVEKVHAYTQTSASGAVPAAAAYSFSAQSPTATVLHVPGGTTATLTAESDRYSLVRSFATQAALDAAFPAGTYTLTATGIPTLSFDLSANLYPTAVPQLTSGTWNNGLLVINPATSNSFNISTFSTYATAGVAGHEAMELDTDTDTFQQSIATQSIFGLTAAAAPLTSVTIPAGTLTAGKVYRLRLNFDTLTTLDTTSISDNGGVAIYESTLEVWVAAVGSTTTIPAAPVIITQPHDTTGVLGGTATFSAALTYSGTGSHVAWFANGMEIEVNPNDPKYSVNFNGQTTTLTVKNLTADDVGKYALKTITISGSATTNDANLTLTTAVAPTVVSGPTNVSVAAGSSAVFSATVSGTTPLSFQWLKNGVAVPSGTTRLLWLQDTTSADAGNYALQITNAAGSVTTSAATLQVANSSDPGRLVNLSVLAVVGAGETLTIGTHLQGDTTTHALPLLVRAGGPSLAPFSISNFLPDPKLSLFGDASVVVATNNDWGGSQQMSDEFSAAGAFAYVAPNSKDAALYQASLAPGNYSAQVTDAGGGSGSVIAEIYDGAPGAYDPGRNRLINLSVFKHIATGDSLSLGFSLGGSTARTFLIRAIGPGLANFQIGDVMADPNLTLYATVGGAQLAANDNWNGSPVLMRAMRTVVAFDIADPTSADAMLLVTLPPGLYSAKVEGANKAGGNAIVEVYDVP